jgi:acetyltransferase
VHVRTSKGVDIFIRPLFESDLDLLKEFLHSLSARSVYYRFLSPIKEFSEKVLARLIQIDHKSHIALAAFHEKESPGILLGVSRLFIEDDLSAAEFSIVVADPWQGKGIGAELFSRCIEIGRSIGVKKIWGLVLSENTQMLKLARKLNFEVKREIGAGEYFVSHDYE